MNWMGRVGRGSGAGRVGRGEWDGESETGRVGRWPTQALLWLEWGCPNLPSSVIPTVADHREAMIREVEGPVVLFELGAA